MDVEQVDLAVVAAFLQRRLGPRPIEGFVPGRTLMRDAVVTELSCSVLEAEALIDTMIGRGFLRFAGAESDLDGTWTIEAEPR
jgi:hypothetical protein